MPKLEIVNEPTYSFGSADSLRKYAFEEDLSGEYRPGSIHGVLLDDDPIAVFGASGGASGVHSNSLLELGERAYLAVGPYVVCFSVSPFQYHWALKTDSATCLGVYYSEDAAAFLSHGELEIARFDDAGRKVWSVSGADIFSEGFFLRQDYVEAIDFNGKCYRFDYQNGRDSAQQTNPADACRRR